MVDHEAHRRTAQPLQTKWPSTPSANYERASGEEEATPSVPRSDTGWTSSAPRPRLPDHALPEAALSRDPPDLRPAEPADFSPPSDWPPHRPTEASLLNQTWPAGRCYPAPEPDGVLSARRYPVRIRGPAPSGPRRAPIWIQSPSRRELQSGGRSTSSPGGSPLLKTMSPSDRGRSRPRAPSPRSGPLRP